MTTHYIDLKVVPDPESGPTQLLGALYDNLHLALVQQRRDTIGISFPDYSLSPRTLGTTLRLHGSQADLQQLMATDWLKGMRDHVRTKEIAASPTDAPQAIQDQCRSAATTAHAPQGRNHGTGQGCHSHQRGTPP